MLFDDYWQMTGVAAEATNFRAVGNSSVSFISTNRTDAGLVTGDYVLKRQDRYYYRERLQPWRKRCTVFRELRVNRLLREAGVAVAPVRLYAENENRTRALLITQRLCPVTTLHQELAKRRGAERVALIQQLVSALLKLHMHRFRHGALYPKHILFYESRIVLIDLEKGRRGVTRMGCAITDLRRLFRYCPELNEGDQQSIINRYSESITGFAVAYCAYEKIGKGQKNRPTTERRA